MLLMITSLLSLLCFVAGRPSKQLSVRLAEGPISRIVGGQPAADGQFPSVLSIEYFRPVTGSFQHICGGFLYKEKYAVTTAACIHNYPVSDLRLKAGMQYRDNPQTSNTQILPVVDYREHPEFQLSRGVPNNIAIITLVSPANTSASNVKNAILPPHDENKFVHRNCYATGYGITAEGVPVYSNTLQWVQMTGITNLECAQMLDGVDNAEIFDSHFCLMSDPPGSGPCNGDGGSPIFCHPSETDSSIEYVAGITSWNAGSSGTCNLLYPSVATRISSYLQWLENNTPL